LLKNPSQQSTKAKPVRQVWETGQAGFGLDGREEHSPPEKL
jgi:hypothetical protein